MFLLKEKISGADEFFWGGAVYISFERVLVNNFIINLHIHTYHNQVLVSSGPPMGNGQIQMHIVLVTVIWLLLYNWNFEGSLSFIWKCCLASLGFINTIIMEQLLNRYKFYLWNCMKLTNYLLVSIILDKH